MTPKEKAKELISIYWNTKVETPHVRESIMSKELAIKCALIAVDELIKSSPQKPRSYTDTMLYWEEVKQEIEKI
jgi:hypothetical protein